MARGINIKEVWGGKKSGDKCPKCGTKLVITPDTDYCPKCKEIVAVYSPA